MTIEAYKTSLRKKLENSSEEKMLIRELVKAQESGNCYNGKLSDKNSIGTYWICGETCYEYITDDEYLLVEDLSLKEIKNIRKINCKETS